MFKKGSLKANVASMFSANLLYALSSWAQLSLVAKFLDGITLGNYTLAIAIVTPLYLLTNMQLRSLIVTDHQDKYNIREYYSFRFVSNVILFVVAAVIGLCIQASDLIVLLLFTLVKIIESNTDVVNSFFQKEERMIYVTKSVGLRSVFGFVGMFIGVFFWENIYIGLALNVCFTGLSYLLYDRKKGHLDKWRFKDIKINTLKNIFLVAYPLGIVIFIISLNSNISKFFLEKYLGTELQGVYSSVSYLLIIGTFVCNAVGQSFTPRLSRYFQDNKIKEFKNLKNKFIIFNFSVGLLAIVFTFFLGDFVLRILFNAEIAKYNGLFIIVMISGLFIYLSTAFGYVLTAMKEFKIQPRINLIILIIKLALVSILIKQYGLYGAVYSSIICSSIQNIITYVYIRRKIKGHEGVY